MRVALGQAINKFGVRRGKQGEPDRDRGARLFHALDLNRAAMLFHTMFDDDETQTGALDGGHILAAIKGGEQALAIITGNTHAAVPHGKHGIAAGAGNGKIHG